MEWAVVPSTVAWNEAVVPSTIAWDEAVVSSTVLQENTFDWEVQNCPGIRLERDSCCGCIVVLN